MSDLDLLSVAAAGMQAQRDVLDIAARNVAASEAAGPKGTFEREVPDFGVVDDSIAVTGAHFEKGSSVDLLLEMLGVMNAARAYEANASVFDLGKRLAERTIDVGRL